MNKGVNKELIQKRGLNYRKYFLKDDRVVVESRNVAKVEKFEVKLEDIGYSKVYVADNPIAGKVMLGVSLLLPVLYLISGYLEHSLQTAQTIMFMLLCGALALFSYMKQHRDDIYLTGGKQNMVFYRNFPSEDVVLGFMDEVTTASKEFLKNKYARFDAFTTDGDYSHRLTYLKEHEIITEHEYYSLLNDFKMSRLVRLNYN